MPDGSRVTSKPLRVLIGCVPMMEAAADQWGGFAMQVVTE